MRLLGHHVKEIPMAQQNDQQQQQNNPQQQNPNQKNPGQQQQDNPQQATWPEPARPAAAPSAPLTGWAAFRLT
jgi:hypothetical protein